MSHAEERSPKRQRRSFSYPEERSPKRQRRSYSPASPIPASDIKAISSQNQPHSLPQTPPPSVHMSPSWQSQSLSSSAHGSATFPTPPSTAGYVSHNNMDRSLEGSDLGQESNMPTPVAGFDHQRDEDGDTQISKPRDISLSDRRDENRSQTDHDRQGTDGRNGRRLFKVNTQPIEPSRPYAEENIISLYSLERIQASVARKDAHGNKINKLRKSYENKVKALGLEGRSKAEVGSLALQGLLDPGWDIDVGNGITAWQARSTDLSLDQGNIDLLLNRLDDALGFANGHLPKSEHESWRNFLGLDDAAAAAATVARPSSTNVGSAQPNIASQNHATLKAATTPASVRASAPDSPLNTHRPDRVNKKRRYDESSYAGYQDAYDDDDGYSTGGHDDRRLGGAKRQKRRDFPTPSSSHTPFSPSMVGIHST